MKRLNLFLVALIGASTMFLTSCSDECEDVTCNNGGTCVEGVCECPASFFGDACDVECINGSFSGAVCDCDDAYEGDACDVLSRDKFIGSYGVSEVCGGFSDTYTVQINSSSSNEENILISNFWDSFESPVVASVDGDDITIATQDPDADGFTVQGSGSINASGNTITLNYTINNVSIGSNTCTATYQKQ